MHVAHHIYFLSYVMWYTLFQGVSTMGLAGAIRNAVPIIKNDDG